MTNTFLRYGLILSLALSVTIVSAQECNNRIKPTAPDYRFTDNGDGTVTDGWTGLMWKKCLEGMTINGVTGGCDGTALQFTWQEGLQRAVAVNNGQPSENLNHGDWRVPNIKELVSLTESSCRYPARNVNVFPTVSGGLWSSTPYSSDAAVPTTIVSVWAYGIDRGFFGTTSPSNQNSVRYIQLVRGI